MSLNTKWGNNVKIYDNGVWGVWARDDIKQRASKLLQLFPFTTSIWLQNNKVLYCNGQTIAEHHLCKHNHHFISSQEQFLLNAWGAQTAGHWFTAKHYWDLRNSFRNHAEYSTSEFKMGIPKHACLNPAFGRGKELLIVGGGPSSNTLDISELIHVDLLGFETTPVVWTMNNVMNNSDLWEQIASYVLAISFLDDVFITEDIIEEVNKHKITVLQEISDRGQQRHQEITNAFDATSYFMTRYRSKLGIGARMLVLASLLKYRTVYFIGMDGYDVTSNITHSFEKDKSLPKWLQQLGPTVQEQQFVVLWDYLLNTLPKMGYNTKYIDLAADCDTSQYRFISQAAGLKNEL